MKTKHFIISSTRSVKKTKRAINSLLLGYENAGKLYDKCRVYEVTIKKVYVPRVRKSIILEENK